MRLSLLIAGLVGFGEGFVSTLMALWAKALLHGGGAALGAIMSVQALGGLLAGALLAGFAHRLKTPPLLAWGGGLTAHFISGDGAQHPITSNSIRCFSGDSLRSLPKD